MCPHSPASPATVVPVGCGHSIENKAEQSLEGFVYLEAFFCCSLSRCLAAGLGSGASVWPVISGLCDQSFLMSKAF